MAHRSRNSWHALLQCNYIGMILAQTKHMGLGHMGVHLAVMGTLGCKRATLFLCTNAGFESAEKPAHAAH